MDALSDVLRVIRLKGGVFLHAEAAFNRAFKRSFGVPPATWRKGALTPPSPPTP